MRRYRAVVGVLIAAIATFLVSCGSAPEAVAPTYTPEKISQLQNYVNRVEIARNRLPELENYIEKDNWVNVDNFTHGPLGQIRSELTRLSNQLLPNDQPKAKAMTEEMLGHLQNLDEASQGRNYGNAISQYREFVEDFDTFLSIVPEDARKKAEDFEAASVYEMTTTIPEPEAIRAEPEEMVRVPVMVDDEPATPENAPEAIDKGEND